MNINEHLLSLPPYLSTTWDEVRHLHLTNSDESDVLEITLQNDQIVKIAGLSDKDIEMIFAYHAKAIEAIYQVEDEDEDDGGLLIPHNRQFDDGMPDLQIEINTPGGKSGILEHDPNLAEMPDLPAKAKEKFQKLAIQFTPDFLDRLPEGQPHCNCPHCQVMRALKQNQIDFDLDEEVRDDELSFREWDVYEINPKAFIVTHPLEKHRIFKVTLEDNFACSCGKNHCEHLSAALKT